MNLLVISYLTNNNLNKINYEPTLYLFNEFSKSMKECKYCDIVKSNIQEYIINKINLLKTKFDYLLIIDNTFNIININKLNNMIKNYIIVGNIYDSRYKDGTLYAKYFNYNKLFINLKNIDIELIKSVKIKNVYFNYYSRIIYSEYKNLLYENNLKSILA